MCAYRLRPPPPRPQPPTMMVPLGDMNSPVVQQQSMLLAMPPDVMFPSPTSYFPQAASVGIARSSVSTSVAGAAPAHFHNYFMPFHPTDVTYSQLHRHGGPGVVLCNSGTTGNNSGSALVSSGQQHQGLTNLGQAIGLGNMTHDMPVGVGPGVPMGVGSPVGPVSIGPANVGLPNLGPATVGIGMGHTMKTMPPEIGSGGLRSGRQQSLIGQSFGAPLMRATKMSNSIFGNTSEDPQQLTSGQFSKGITIKNGSQRRPDTTKISALTSDSSSSSVSRSALSTGIQTCASGETEEGGASKIGELGNSIEATEAGTNETSVVSVSIEGTTGMSAAVRQAGSVGLGTDGCRIAAESQSVAQVGTTASIADCGSVYSGGSGCNTMERLTTGAGKESGSGSTSIVAERGRERIHNDYNQHFVDTGERSQNFIRDADESERFLEYPKLARLMQLKKEVTLKRATPAQLIQADLHSFDFGSLGTKFDVILVDPPWSEYHLRVAGGFSPSEDLTPWSLDQLKALPVDKLGETPSFCFLWCGVTHLEEARTLLTHWGYRRCEDICWLKTNKRASLKRRRLTPENFLPISRGTSAYNPYCPPTYSISLTYPPVSSASSGGPCSCCCSGSGCLPSCCCTSCSCSSSGRFANVIHDEHSLLQRSNEHCLMGIKGTVRRSTDTHFIHANLDTDVIVAEEPDELGSTAKPAELYEVIERFCLGRKRIELFATDRNIRDGWLSIGKTLSFSNFRAAEYNSWFEGDVAWPEVQDFRGGRYTGSTPEIELLRPKSPPRSITKSDVSDSTKSGQIDTNQTPSPTTASGSKPESSSNLSNYKRHRHPDD